LTVAWTIVTLVVAVLGTIVVAWQAYETHRTTTLSQRTLEASHSLAIDSARSRLDLDAPRIDVYVEQVSVLPGDSTGAAGAAVQWGLPGLPGHASRLLRVQARVRVVNLMDNRTIHLKVSGMQDPTMRSDTEVLLVPSAKLLYFLTATFPLSQWAQNWEAHRAGEPLPFVAAGRVIASDDRDEGVVDTWPLRLSAWPIEPAGDEAGTWKLTSGGAGDDWFSIAIRPLRERSYWISQRRKIPMPEPSYDKPG
jgi:hypothetical protein